MTQPPIAPQQPVAATYAGWGARVGALVLDSVPTAVVLGVLTAAFGDNQTTGSRVSFSLTGLPFVVYLVFAIGRFVYNWIIRQGSTGQTIGKNTLGIAVLGADTRQPIGGGLTFVRQLAHVLDAMPCFIGYLWPIWDGQRRTFADMVMSTRVVKVQQ